VHVRGVFLGLLGAGLVACYAPEYSDCEITCGVDGCPSGLTCDQGFCRVEGFTGLCGGDPNGDTDTDGVKNSIDNCPALPNADQGNEDGDARGDLCDPCPIAAAPAADMDSDTDGVGDGCDPFPGQQSKMTVFEGFNVAPLTSPRLLPSPTSWVFENGKALVSNPGPNMVAAMTWPLASAATSGEVVVAGFANNQPSTTAPTGAGVTTFFDAGQQVGIVCWVARDTANGVNIEGLELYSRQVAGSQVSSAYPLVAAAPTSTRLVRNSNAHQCIDKQNRMVMQNYALPSTSAPHAGVFVMSSGVSFEYVMIVTAMP
jgi:hypothetical protein